MEFTIEVPIDIELDEVEVSGDGTMNYAVIIDGEIMSQWHDLDVACSALVEYLSDLAGLSCVEAEVVADRMTEEHYAALPPKMVTVEVRMTPHVEQLFKERALKCGYEGEHRVAEWMLDLADLSCVKAE